MDVPYPATSVDYERVIHAARHELEAAGNPSFVVAIVDAAGTAELSAVVYSTIRPASDEGRRLGAAVEPGETVVIVSRQAQGHRANYAILEPASLRKLHQQLEVIERSFAEDDFKI
jgi:hypothetical protein